MLYRLSLSEQLTVALLQRLSRPRSPLVES